MAFKISFSSDVKCSLILSLLILENVFLHYIIKIITGMIYHPAKFATVTGLFRPTPRPPGTRHKPEPNYY